MSERLSHLLAHLFSFDITADLLRRDFVQQALLAAALLALVSGLIGPFIVMRQMSFAVHGSSELSLTGGAFALLAGFNVGVGALVGSALAAVLFGILGQRTQERDSAIGVRKPSNSTRARPRPIPRMARPCDMWCSAFGRT